MLTLFFSATPQHCFKSHSSYFQNICRRRQFLTLPSLTLGSTPPSFSPMLSQQPLNLFLYKWFSTRHPPVSGPLYVFFWPGMFFPLLFLEFAPSFPLRLCSNVFFVVRPALPPVKTLPLSLLPLLPPNLVDFTRCTLMYYRFTYSIYIVHLLPAHLGTQENVSYIRTGIFTTVLFTIYLRT